MTFSSKSPIIYSHRKVIVIEFFIPSSVIFVLIFTPQPLRAVRVLFCPDGWVGLWAGGEKKFVRAVSQKP